MKTRPSKDKLIKKFIEKADKEIKEEGINLGLEGDNKILLYWPFFGNSNPILEEGGDLSRPINLPLKEFEWNTLDRHTKKLNISKSKWIRYAIYKLLEEEQKKLSEKH